MLPWLDPAGSAASPLWGERNLRVAIGIVCSALLMTMMVLTVCDVMGRYLLNAPIRGATEVTEMLLAAVIFIGLPAASMDREHVTVDLLTDRLPGAVRRLLHGLVLLVSAAVLGVIAWRMWLVGGQIASYGGTTPSLKLPVAPLAYGMAVLCGLTALITLALLLPPRRGGNNG